MQDLIPRREFLLRMGAAASAAVCLSMKGLAAAIKSPFRVAVINDEITQDFERACEIASREFGMEWIELRGMWKKNILNLDANEVGEAQRILEKYHLRVTDIASPLFKADWPGAPKSRFRPKGAEFGASFASNQQDELLERCIALAKTFHTDRIRCFDFWRLDDPAPYRSAINEKLLEAAKRAGKDGMMLLLENEGDCNTATGAEAAKTLQGVKTPHLMLNWDPGNAAARGEKAYPDGYELLPKDRIGHCHCKDVSKRPAGSYTWAAKRNGYHYAVSLETHWRGAGTAEESTRQSWAGMKKELQEAGALQDQA